MLAYLVVFNLLLTVILLVTVIVRSGSTHAVVQEIYREAAAATDHIVAIKKRYFDKETPPVPPQA